MRLVIRTVVGAHDGTNKFLVLEHLASLGTKVGVHITVESSSSSETIHDLINFTGSQSLLAGLGCCIKKGFSQLDQVDLTAVIVVKGREGRQQLGAW